MILPVYADDEVVLFHGDCREVLSLLADDSVDSIVCDPPYEYSFMGKSWDGSGIAYSVPMWRECLRVLKPGGHMLVAGSSRTHHRVACAIEDAGFEIRDTICHVFGSGFPKSASISKAIDKAAGAERKVTGSHPYASRKPNGTWTGEVYGDEPEHQQGPSATAPATDAAKQWDGWGTALKPAAEFWTLARKSLSEKTVAANVIKHGTGAINVDATRISTTDKLGGGDQNVSTKVKTEGWDRPWMQDEEAKAAHAARVNENVEKAESLGRWPPNILLTHSSSCQAVGEKKVRNSSGSIKGDEPSAVTDAVYAERERVPWQAHGDADGMETVQAWTCVTDADGSECDRLLLSILDSPDRCPSCFHFCDGQAHRILAAGQELPQLQDGAFVVGSSALATTLERIRQNLQTPLPTLDVEDLCAKPGSTPESKISHEFPGHACVHGIVVGSACTESPEPQRSGLTGNRQQSSTVSLSGSSGTEDHSACRDEAKRLLQNWSSITILHESCPVAEMDRQSGNVKSGGNIGAGNEPKFKDVFSKIAERSPYETRKDAGGASRFFPQFEPDYDFSFRYQAKAPKKERPKAEGAQQHPTVKPLALMRWLVRLATPPHGVVLDMFCGSGTTLQAAGSEGFRSIGIDSWEDAIMQTGARLGIEVELAGEISAGDAALPGSHALGVLGRAAGAGGARQAEQGQVLVRADGPGRTGEQWPDRQRTRPAGGAEDPYRHTWTAPV